MAGPRGATRSDITKKMRVPLHGDILTTPVLDGTDTESTIKVANPGEKLAFQRTGTLECNIEFCLNGIDFQDTMIVNDATVTTFTSYPVTHIKVTRTAGTGKLVIVTR